MAGVGAAGGEEIRDVVAYLQALGKNGPKGG